MIKNYTMGPWFMSDVRVKLGEYEFHGIKENGTLKQETIALVFYTPEIHTTCLNNAKLIAAAPTLADTLKELLNEYLSNVDYYRLGGFYTDPEKEPCVIRARAVLADIAGDE